jgi:hypothetical protein
MEDVDYLDTRHHWIRPVLILMPMMLGIGPLDA